MFWFFYAIGYLVYDLLCKNYFMLSKSRYISILSSRSFSHMVVDFCCAAAVFSIWNFGLLPTETFIQWVLLYNILAFGLQLFLWIFADKTEYSQSISYIGCILVWIWVCIFAMYPILSMIFLWLGNACFHIWWWILTLALNPWKAREPWIFVAPGGVWLILWTLLWKAGNFYCREWLVLLWIWLITMAWSSKDFLPYKNIKEYAKKEKLKKHDWKLPIIIIISLLTICIIIRSFVWFLVSYSWKTGALISISFVVCLEFWKALWWFFADKRWWLKIWVWSLLLSLPFLLLWEMCPICWFIGIFLFNITMSIALVGMVKVVPNKPWFSFWLLCMWLLIWALPTLLHMSYQWMETILLIYLVLLSAWALWVALNSSK